MWSDSYRDYVKQLVISNRNEYPYYIAHTCTYWGVSSSASYPAFKVYFSKEPITANGLYSYVCPTDTVVYSVIGSNANSNYHTSRVSTSKYSGALNIDNYEFVYTNAEFTGATVQPDVLASTDIQQSHFDGVSLILLVILLGTLVAKLVKR